MTDIGGLLLVAGLVTLGWGARRWRQAMQGSYGPSFFQRRRRNGVYAVGWSALALGAFALLLSARR